MLNDIIRQIDAEIALLTEARRILSDSRVSATKGTGVRRRRSMSAEARAHIAAGQRKRWAARRAGKKK